MKDTENKLLILLHKHQLSIEDKQWLLDYIDNTDQKELIQLLNIEFNDELKNDNRADIDFPEQVLNKIYAKAGIQTHDRPKVKYLWLKRIAIAGTIAGLISAAFFWHSTTNRDIAVQRNQFAAHISQNDFVSAGNKAVLMLSSGKKIILDSAKNGLVANQGSSVVVKATNGQLVYNSVAKKQGQLLFNTIITPRGGHYQVTLPDGSQVWLNAASSIRFPTSFTTNVRVVEITGEAYFEVAKNKEKPFIVKANNAEVKVLGTHFNVNAYTDEPGIKTTLLEGAVQFSSGNSQYLLRPGQQAELNKAGEIRVLADADIESAMAWKNGMLSFEDADIGFIMRQLSRLYDVDIVYRTKTRDHFFVKLPADSKLSDVLKMMELTGRISFTIEGKSVIVN